jgi:hypothetical protein
MKPQLPGPASIIGLMFSAVTATWLGIFGPLDLTGLKNWQTLISAIVAAAGIAAAAYNVSRQIRINILVREEDRIEKQLPGLRNAVNFLRSFVTSFRQITAFYRMTSEFARHGFGTAGSTFEKDIEKALPLTDDATRSTALCLLMQAYSAASSAQGSRGLIEQLEDSIRDPSQWAPGEVDKVRNEIAGARREFESQRDKFRNCIDNLNAEVDAIEQKIVRYDRRKKRIRSEVERYFGD